MSMWDDEAGYDMSDPKHPTYGERWAEAVDNRRKAERENRDSTDNTRPEDAK